MACKCRSQQTFRTNKKVTELDAPFKDAGGSPRAVYLTDGEQQICGQHGDADSTGLQEDPPLSENPVWPENAVYSGNQRNSLESDHIGDHFSSEKYRVSLAYQGRATTPSRNFQKAPVRSGFPVQDRTNSHVSKASHENSGCFWSWVPLQERPVTANESDARE